MSLTLPGGGSSVAGGRTTASVSVLLTNPRPVLALGALLASLPPCVDEVVIVGATAIDVLDVTAREGAPSVGEGPDVRVVVEQRPGRGNALRAGLAAATGELLVAMDADGRMSADEIPQFLYFLQRGFDLVRGSRFVAGGAAIELGPSRRVAQRGIVLIANRLFETGLSDIGYGYFAVRRHFLDQLELTSPGEEIEAEIAVRAALAGLRIAEVPSRERARRDAADRREFLTGHGQVLATLLLLRGGRLARLGTLLGEACR